jgi:hypothetical protein
LGVFPVKPIRKIIVTAIIFSAITGLSKSHALRVIGATAVKSRGTSNNICSIAITGLLGILKSIAKKARIPISY